MTSKAELIEAPKQDVQHVIRDEGAVILSMIDKLSANPDISVERVEQMFDLYQRTRNDAARRSYNAALAEMAPSLPVIEKRGKGHGSIKYAKWEDIVGDINPVIAKHGFALSFRTENLPDGKMQVTCILSHRDGHSDQTSLVAAADTSGSKNAIQSIGSTVSYLKRYTACALLNIAGKDEDTDGRLPTDTITDDQVKVLQDLIKETDTNTVEFLKHAGIESLTEIYANKFEAAKGLLLAKKAKMQKVAKP